MNAVGAGRRCTACPLTGAVEVRAAELKHAAQLLNWSLPRPLGDQLVNHFSSRAKKADAFFRISLSDFSWLLLRRQRLAHAGPAGAFFCSTQRRTALSTKFLSRQTCPTLRPCTLIMRTTCSLKAASKARLDLFSVMLVLFSWVKTPIEVSIQIGP